MNDTTDSTEQMPLVPDADGYEQRVDDGRDETLLMHIDAELEAESTMEWETQQIRDALRTQHILQLERDYISVNLIKWARMIWHYRGGSDEITADVTKKKVMTAKGELPFSVTKVNDHMKKVRVRQRARMSI